jgi:hypothetical protein
MIKRHGKLKRGAILFGIALSSIGNLAKGMGSRRTGGQRWLTPLAVFLCATGLLLLFAFSVEALAPFIYAIF